MADRMSLRDLWLTVLDHLPFREESRLVAARDAVNNHFPEEDASPETSETSETERGNVTSAGVKDGSGGDWNPNSGLPNPNA